MPFGVVKWFDPVRGEGVIVLDDGGEAVAHRSEVHGVAERVMVEGERVFCDVTRDGWGARADNICPAVLVSSAPAEGPEGDAAVPQGGVWLVGVEGRVSLPCRGSGSVRRALGVVGEWLLCALAWGRGLRGRVSRRTGESAVPWPGTAVAGTGRSRWPDVKVSGLGPGTAVGVGRADARDDTALGTDEVDACPWCVQLQEAATRDRQPERKNDSPVPWMVPPGLPPRPAEPDR